MEFRILGPLEVVNGGRPVHISGAKERAVLAILLLHANEVVSADRLVDELWGERPPATARKSLQVRVSALRNALGNEMLVTQRSGYLIGLDAEALDLHRFERLVAEARAALAGDRPDVAARGLRTALALWRGPPLLEFAYQPFAQGAIARLEELRFAALELRIDADLACGLHAEAVGELEALVTDHPLRERPRGLLMLALYRSGRQADALEVYRRTRQTLLDELGITPSPALQQLEQAILRQEPTLDLATAPTPQRSILVAALSEASVDVLLAVGQPLAARPSRELILAYVLGSADDIGRASAALDQRRAALIERGIAARPAVFTSPAPAQDIVRLAGEQDVDLLIVEAPASLLDDPVLRAVLETAPCDVGVLVRGEKETSGPVLVPFAGAEHDWSAVELGAWIARAERIPLRLAGPIGKERDASRLLASASLAVQRVLGVVAEPQVVAPGPEGLLMAAEHAALVVVGLSDRWRTDGLGTARLALATKGRAPVLLVRRGLRPGGLAPRESLTRYTWSLAVA